MEQPNTNWLQAERDPSVQSVSFSEDVSVPIIQPVQSVTVSKKQTGGFIMLTRPCYIML